MSSPPWDPSLRPDVAVLIALPEEFRSLAAEYSRQWHPKRNPDHPGSDFLFVGPGGHRCVATIMPRMGPMVASQVSTRLLAWKPAVILNVGIAGGFKDDLRIGDVIVPRQVDAYGETAKMKGARWERRGSDYRPSAELLAEVQELEFTSHEAHEGWVKAGHAQLAELRAGADRAGIEALLDRKLLRDRPTISTNHLASGSFVVASKPFAEWIREANADIHAGEMEAAGMMAAAEYHRRPVSTLVVRGISDHVDADKSELDAIGEGALRRLAMANAWRLVCTLMELGLLPRAEEAAVHVEPRNVVAISPPSPSTPRIRIEGLRSDALQIFGRDRELAFLDRTWAESEPGKTNIVAFVAAGGVGKTSLVTEWINRLRDDGWRGAELVFTHSFYSQGVRDQGTASADAFVNEALRFFGDAELAGSNAAPERKGARLADLVARQRALLVLDGLEPLQQPPREGVHAGELKDPALRSLLGGLAHHNQGLCVLTTREAVYDLRSKGRAVREWDLEQLSEEASGALLEFLLTSERFKGPAIATTAGERAEIWEVVKGHAFTLQLLGRYLRRRRWDVRRWRDIRFEAADASVAGGHAFRMLDAYERWLGGKDAGGDEAPDGTRQLAVLRLLGFFDRPADPACIGALCQAPAIEGLTEPLVELDEEGWDAVLADLEDLGLVTRESWEPARVKGFREEQADLDTGEAEGEPEETPMPGWPRLTVELDAHPLVRQHFGRRVQETSETAWKEGHRRVFEHLCASTPYWPEGVEGLGPLFQAVAHGCQAEEVQRACDEVYYGRILRGTSGGGFYSTKKLGAFGAELGAVAWFFESRWSQPSPRLTNGDQAWLLNEAAFCLRALGRLAEAVEPMRAGLERRVKQENWRSAAIIAGNLSQLELTRGEVTEASRVAEQSVTFADRSTDAFQRMGKRTTHADALHHAGRRDEARRRFEEAEAIQAERQPGYPRLYSLQGFQCCDLLLFEAEHAAWRVTMARGAGSSSVALLGDARSSTSADAAERDRALAACADVLERAAQTLEWVTPRNLLLTIALDQLTLSRATLYRALLAAPPPDSISDPARGSTSPADLAAANQHINTAVDGLRRSGHLDHLPHGLLSRAWLRHLQSNPTAAATDLDEVEELATRCGMPIFLADAHLTRARLFRDHAALADARTLLADLRTRGYHRHDEMLADTELFAADWPPATP